MKVTVKNPALLQKLAASAYNTKLKASFLELELASEQGDETCSYLFHSEHTFQDGKTGPLLIFGKNNAWKEHIKKESWVKPAKAKQSAVGTALFQNNTLQLVLEQGKITPANFKKAIKENTILKRYEWEFIDALPTAPIPSATPENASTDVVADSLLELIATFQQRGQQFKTLSKAITDTTDKKQKHKYLIQRKKVLRLLKNNCQNWEELSEEDNTIQQHPLYSEGAQHYTQWSQLLQQLKAAKNKESDDQGSIELEEEQLYAKALSDVQNFNASLAGVKEVDTIEEAVTKLNKHVQQWETMTNKGEKGKLATDFQEIKAQYTNIQKGWNILKPILTQWHSYKEQLEALQAKGEQPSDALINDFLNSNERLQNAL